MAELRVFGQRVRPLEPVSRVGDLLGLSRSAAYRSAAEWPCVGRPGARRVVLPALLGSLGIPYEAVSAHEGDDPATASAEETAGEGIRAGQGAEPDSGARDSASRCSPGETHSQDVVR
jgi:hypothetical protein